MRLLVVKKIFLWCLVYFWGLGVAIPYISYLIFGIFNTSIYTYVPDVYLHKTALILTVSVLISILLILAVPTGRGLIEPKYELGNWYIIGLLLFFICSRIRLGNGSVAAAFEATTAGEVNGTFVAYMGLFCDVTYVMFLYFLSVKKNVKYFTILLLYVIYTVLCASRSGLLTIVFVLITVLFASSKFKNQKKKMVLIIFLAIMLSPFVFMFSTSSRNMSAGNDRSKVINTIVGRCSQLEIGGIALYKASNGTWDENVFLEKYGLQEQVKLVINSIVPGDIFDGDVDPNQYYRTVFLETPEQVAHDNYTSMNLTLPIYLSLKYGVILGIILTAIIVFIWYIFCCLIKNQAMKILYIIAIRDIMTYFDWVMIWRIVFTMTLTAVVFNILDIIMKNKKLVMWTNRRIEKLCPKKLYKL